MSKELQSKILKLILESELKKENDAPVSAHDLLCRAVIMLSESIGIDDLSNEHKEHFYYMRGCLGDLL